MFGTITNSFDFMQAGFWLGVLLWGTSCGVQIVVKAIRGIGGSPD